MTTIDEELRARIIQAPCDSYHVIVRTDRHAEEVAAQCRHEGIQVHRQYRLLPALALTASGEALLALADNPHVKHIEADREYSAI